MLNWRHRLIQSQIPDQHEVVNYKENTLYIRPKPSGISRVLSVRQLAH